MKILCVADHIDPLVYSLNNKERFKDVSLVLSAGDLPMEYLGFISSTLNKPVLFVFGNHNLKRLELFSKGSKQFPYSDDEDRFNSNHYGSVHIDNRCLKEQGLLIAGLGGSIRYNDGENQFTDLQMFFKIIRMFPRLFINKLLHGRYLDILLTHAAPFGIQDKDDPCHRGFKSFKWFMKIFKPVFLLHGHIHLYSNNSCRESRYMHTRVINVYDHFVLETNRPKGNRFV